MARSVPDSLRVYARGVAGGLLFSLPLLYTMEVWWAGFLLSPARLIAYMLVTFVLLLGYNRYAGMHQASSWLEVVLESVEEMGLGLIVAAVFLWLIGQISAEMPNSEIFGKIVIESMTVAIGVSVGTAQLGSRSADEDGGDEPGRAPDERGETGREPAARDERGQDAERQSVAGGRQDGEPSFVGQLVIAFCGAVLFSANVAPTEEIQFIAAQATAWKLLGLALGSLIVGGGILHYSGFMDSARFVRAGSFRDNAISTIVLYAVALGASAMILWFFGRFEDTAPGFCLAQTVVLGMAGALGASAGRVLIQ